MNVMYLRILSSLLLLAISNNLLPHTLLPMDSLCSPGNVVSVNVVESNSYCYKVMYQIHGLYNDLVQLKSDTYQKLSFGCDYYLSEIGNPALPVLKELIAIPEGCSIGVSIVDEEWTEISVKTIWPAQEPKSDSLIQSSFALDNNVYGKPFFPPIVTVGEEMNWRGIRNCPILICPFKYYPNKNVISLLREFTLQVSFRSNDKDTIGNSLTELDNTYSLFDNMTNNSQKTRKTSDRNSDTYDYLIIVGSGTGVLNSTALEEFQKWKAFKGYKTKAVSTSTTGYTASQIKNYILQEYNKGVRYVLFIGDATQIPINNFYTPRGRYVDSDYWYGCLGGDNDQEADVAIGRMPVSNVTDFLRMEKKTLKYESVYNATDEVLLVAHMEYAGWTGSYQYCSEYIRTYPYTESMSFVKAYGASTNGGTNATNAFVVNKINQSSHIVNYRGHGGYNLWGNPYWNASNESFTVSQIDSLSDETCAVFFSIACQTGNIGNQGCMLTTFMKSYHGAVAFIGATADTNTDANNTYDMYLFHHLLNNQVYNIGDLNVAAHISNLLPNVYYMDNPYCYVCGGDPTLEIWTSQPQSMGDVEVSLLNNNVTISTSLAGDYFLSVVSETGEHLYNIQPTGNSVTFAQPSDVFYVVVNKHNYYPHVIYINKTIDYIQDKVFTYDAYYEHTPMLIGEEVSPIGGIGDVIIKSGNKVVIKNTNGVTIENCFECEEGACFEIK